MGNRLYIYYNVDKGTAKEGYSRLEHVQGDSEHLMLHVKNQLNK